jgi:hypothetical protein
MTDGEIDDHSSMIRFLLYTCDVEVKAIIETNSMFQLNGHSDKSWYEDQLAAYEAVYPNLIKHHPGYPTADELRAISFVGDENYEHLKGTRETRWEQIPGGPVEFDPAGWPDTPGSDAIVRILLEDDPAPIHLQAWGGGNTASRAFYKLKRDHPADYERALSKVVMYNIWYQDDAGNYIETHHPLVTMVHCAAFAGTWNYDSQPNTHDFITQHVKNGHGPLGALYPQTYVSEGDSPAFFYVVDNGLRNHEHPGFGGWGGRFKKVDGFERVYIDAGGRGREESISSPAGLTRSTATSRHAWTGAFSHHEILPCSIRPDPFRTRSCRLRLQLTTCRRRRRRCSRRAGDHEHHPAGVGAGHLRSGDVRGQRHRFYRRRIYQLAERQGRPDHLERQVPGRRSTYAGNPLRQRQQTSPPRRDRGQWRRERQVRRGAAFDRQLRAVADRNRGGRFDPR